MSSLSGGCLQTDIGAPEISMEHTVSLSADSALDVYSILPMIRDMALCGYILYAHHTMLRTSAPQISAQIKGCSLPDVTADAYFLILVQSQTSFQLLHSPRSIFSLATTRGDVATGR